MANLTYNGQSIPATRSVTITVTTTTNGHTYIITPTDPKTGSSGATFTHTVVGAVETTTTLVATALLNEFNANQDSHFGGGVDCSQSANTLTFTAKRAGVPFAFAYSGTGTWGTEVLVQENRGGEDFLDEGNYAGNVAYSSGDSVVFTGNASCSYNMAGITLANLESSVEWTGRIGEFNASLNATISTAVTMRGRGEFHINMGSSNKPVTVEGSNNAMSTLIGTNISTGKFMGGANVLIGGYEAQATTAATVEIQDAFVKTGTNCTLTTFSALHPRSKFELWSAATTLNAWDGKGKTEGAGAITTVNVTDAKVVFNATGTIGTLNAQGSAGVSDFTQSRVARTVTAANGYAGAVYYDSHITIAATNYNKSNNVFQIKSPAGSL